MSITATMVKDLREKTGVGMMQCKKALIENNGDMEAAIEYMRKKGMASAAKRASRVAAEGVIMVAQQGTKAAIVEVNSETDFVAKGDDFLNFARAIAESSLSNNQTNLDRLAEISFEGQSIEENRRQLIAKIGENISIRRCQLVAAEDALGVYQHGTRIGVLVALSGCKDSLLAKDIAMHIAASRPQAIDSAALAEDVVLKEKEIFAAQARESGKPETIVAKMVEGRLRKFIEEITLVNQPFVKNTDQTVGDLLKQSGAKVSQFVRFEVGEGIQKKVEDFAKEVAAVTDN